jgi:hypothetical protein
VGGPHGQGSAPLEHADDMTHVLGMPVLDDQHRSRQISGQRLQHLRCGAQSSRGSHQRHHGESQRIGTVPACRCWPGAVGVVSDRVQPGHVQHASRRGNSIQVGLIVHSQAARQLGLAVKRVGRYDSVWREACSGNEVYSGFGQQHPYRTGPQVWFPVGHGSVISGVLAAEDVDLAAGGEPWLPELAVRSPRQGSVVQGCHLPWPGCDI